MSGVCLVIVITSWCCDQDIADGDNRIKEQMKLDDIDVWSRAGIMFESWHAHSECRVLCVVAVLTRRSARGCGTLTTLTRSVSLTTP